MKLDIIKIGNSQGVRLPKALLKQCNLKGKVVVKVEEGKLILSADTSDQPRAGWDKAFTKMAQAGDDKLVEPTDYSLSSDNDEWTW